MAAIATITNNALLKERAAKFMDTVKGKWFDVEVPENYTFEFVKLAQKIAPFLTVWRLYVCPLCARDCVFVCKFYKYYYEKWFEVGGRGGPKTFKV